MMHAFLNLRLWAFQIVFRLLSLCLLMFSVVAMDELTLASESRNHPSPALPASGRPKPMQLSSWAEEMPDPRVQALIDQVTPTLVYSYVANLSGEQPVVVDGLAYTIRDRNTWNERYGNMGIQYASRYAHEKFRSFGLSTREHVWHTQANPNVIAEQPGYGLPDDVYYLTAHLDDMPYIAPNVLAAPGADDNASGSVGVLIAAEILGQANCHAAIRYVLFTGEEQGLLGSRAYVESVLGEHIQGVLNLDMIGWDSDGDTALDLYARMGYPDDHRIAATFARVVNAYKLPLIPEILGDRLSDSDHASFWDRGYPAILAIEDLSDFNEHYHTSEDRLVYLDINYLTAFIRASVGAMAHLACLAPAPVYLPILNK